VASAHRRRARLRGCHRRRAVGQGRAGKGGLWEGAAVGARGRPGGRSLEAAPEASQGRPARRGRRRPPELHARTAPRAHRSTHAQTRPPEAASALFLRGGGRRLGPAAAAGTWRLESCSRLGAREREEREEREWRGQSDLQWARRGRAWCPLVSPRVRAVCPLDPNVNHIWDRYGSGENRLSVWVASLGALLSIFLSARTHLDRPRMPRVVEWVALLERP
jgi:hypothetical protein